MRQVQGRAGKEQEVTPSGGLLLWLLMSENVCVNERWTRWLGTSHLYILQRRNKERCTTHAYMHRKSCLAEGDWKWPPVTGQCRHLSSFAQPLAVSHFYYWFVYCWSPSPLRPTMVPTVGHKLCYLSIHIYQHINPIILIIHKLGHGFGIEPFSLTAICKTFFS